MIEVRVIRNDLPKLIKANEAIEKKMGRLMEAIGEMRLKSAQEAFNKEGPGWRKHSKRTIERHGVHKLLALEEDLNPLSNVKSNFTVSLPIKVRGGMSVRIVPSTSHSRLMTAVHNKPRGTITVGNHGSKIPGRPFFLWRVSIESRKARVLMKQYLGRTFRKYGITMRGLGLEF